jgi:hypothetical protein
MSVRRTAARAALCGTLSVLTLLPATAQASGGGSTTTVTAIGADNNAPPPGSSGAVTVLLSGGAPSGGSLVSLTSSDPSALALPTSVRVPQGASSAQATYTTGAVARPTPVTLKATLGSSSASTAVTVTPLGLLSVLAIPSTVQGGGADTIRPQLTGPAPPGGALVALASDSSLLPVPATVTIPAGSFGTPVSVTTGAVTTTTIVNVTATYAGASVTGQLTLTPPDVPVSVSFNPAQTSGTDGAQGIVTLANPGLPTGDVVSLQSSNPAIAAVPASTTVGQGTTIGGFTVTTAAVAATTTVTISATENGVTVSGVLTLTPPPPPVPALQSIAVGPGSVAGGHSATATATLNVPAPAGGALISLVSSNTGAAKVPATLTVAAGSTTATFAVSTLSQGTTTTVAIGGTYGASARAALLGVTGTRGGSVLPAPPSGVFIDPPWLDPTPEGANGTIQITWFGTLDSETLTVASGSLPPGLTLISPFRPLTAAISGIPTTPGTYAFVMKFTGASGTAFAWPYVWQIGPPAPLVVDQANFGPGTVGQAYDGGFFYGGGVAPYSWSISAGALPPGLRINSSTSEVTGTPTTRGTFAFTARLTDAKGATLDTPETITIS